MIRSIGTTPRRRMLRAVLALASAGLSACATMVPPVEVTRFHAAPPVASSGTISIDEALGNPDVSMEFRTYAAAVGQELQRIGFREIAPASAGAKSPATSEYVALVSYHRSFRSGGPTPSPVSVGVGGSTGSYGSGVGLGIGINLSGKPKDIVTSELSVQIRRRADSVPVWEGRARTEAKENNPAAQPGLAAAKLAAALFKDYPGESGKTVIVK
jgi:Domain of unknown function (DUF4136)